MRNKQIITLVVVVLAIGAILFAFRSSITEKIGNLRRSDPTAEEVWTTFQSYLGFAREHNLEGVKSLSVRLSPACQDPAQEKECLRLMDSVSTIGGEFKREDFKHFVIQGNEIFLYTDYLEQARIILKFIEARSGKLLLDSIKICAEDLENPLAECFDEDAPNQEDKEQ